MSGYKNLEILGSMSKHVTRSAIDQAIALVGMENRIHDKVGIYSMGMKQRIGLAQALIHKPDLFILDEPTNGLDPQGIHEFREIVPALGRDSPYIPESGIASIEIEIKQLRYFIENDINPITPSAAKFSIDFVEQGISLLIPLIIVILAADLVSGEFSTGTIKVLLTRAVPRWKILMSKFIAPILITTLVVLKMFWYKSRQQ